MAESHPKEKRTKVRLQASILTQVLLASGIVLVLALFIAVIGFLGLQNFQREINTTLREANQIREMTSNAQAQFLLARQSEAEFMNLWRTVGMGDETKSLVADNDRYMTDSRYQLSLLEDLVASSSDPEMQSIQGEIQVLRPLFSEYEETFQKTVEIIRERTSTSGIDAAIKAEILTLQTSFASLSDPTYIELLFKIQQNEQSYYATRRYEYYDNVRIQVSRLIGRVKISTSADLEGSTLTKQEIIAALESYLAMFNQVVVIEQGIEVNTTIFKDTTEKINENIDRILAASQEGVAKANTEIRTTGYNATLTLAIAAVLALTLGAGVSTLISYNLVRPIRKLTDASEKMGRGEFVEPLKIKGPVEIFSLAETFNSMASQLQDMLAGLEKRVAERTQDLERRSAQLQVASEVARDSASIRDLDVLLTQAVNLIRTRFGFYHAGIFLADQKHEYAVLRAATGDAGRAMLEQEHKLKIGQVGIVGKVVETGEPRISLDVGGDTVHYKNPLLPKTRSELALPLKAGTKVIGALDVQSQEPEAFDEQEIAVLQIMADQLAVAIENARLFQETEENIQQLQAVYSSYSKKAWDSIIHKRNLEGYVYQGGDLQRIETGEEMIAPESIPLLVRGQAVGSLDIWPQNEVLTTAERKLAEALSERIGQAMESARLYEEAQARAGREEALSQLTATFTRSLSLDTLLKTAVQELGKLPNITEVSIQLETPEQVDHD